MDHKELSKLTFLDVFLHRLEQNPERVILKYLDDSGKKEDDITYRKIDDRAKSIARYLRKKTKPGDRVGLMYAQSPEFMYTYMACLYAECIPVSMNIPIRRQAVNRLRAIFKDSGVKIIFTDRNIHRLLWIYFLFKKVKFLPSARFKKKVKQYDYPELQPDDIALLQYTSGSTGRPNGVMVTHKSLLYQLYTITLATEIKEHRRVVSWLPSFHDMGYIGGYALPVFVNSLSILMSPLAFLKSPLNWIKAVSRLEVDSTYMPNFGLGISASKIKPADLKGVDLSCFQQVYCGSEPIRKQTIDDFYDRFMPAGMHEQAVYPCYGMAETVLVISMAPRWTDMKYLHVSKEAMKQGRLEETGQEDDRSVTVFSCGPTWGDTHVEIVDPDTRLRKKETEIGEIWVKGSTVTAGYWQHPEKTQETFNATLKDTGEDGFLKTGDLGVIIDGELYVTGRLKDLIIIRGQNYYPHDLESVLEGLHPAMRINNCSVFSIDGDDRELIVVLQEIRKRQEGKYDPKELFELIRGTMAREFNIGPDAIALIPQGTLPKTTSGKIQRFKCRNLYLNNNLKIIDQWKQADTLESIGDIEGMSLEEFLTNLIARKTGHSADEIEVQEKIFNYGVDSLMAVEITDLLEEHTQKSLSPNLLWEKETISAICKEIERS